ncbi:uncharacterized protein LOC128955418 [Oppia nitens]|uniref:uncharacterized protein LOC128955418 n=1 Tax=Oppia nitens TaxID=1686743 RepID=UPI0023DC1962|nr:uncharacterized protein LOC128955418 [Oppia nitens]
MPLSIASVGSGVRDMNPKYLLLPMVALFSLHLIGVLYLGIPLLNRDLEAPLAGMTTTSTTVTDSPISILADNSSVDSSHKQSANSTSTPTPLPPKPTIDEKGYYCLFKSRWLIASYLIVWLVSLLIETLVIGFSLSGVDSVDLFLKFLLKIKLGLLAIELLVLLINTIMIGLEMGYIASLDNRCPTVLIGKAIADVTIFSWMSYSIIVVLMGCHLMQQWYNQRIDASLGDIPTAVNYGGGDGGGGGHRVSASEKYVLYKPRNYNLTGYNTPPATPTSLYTSQATLTERM